MSDIFLSYSSVDRARAHTLASLLGSTGWSVWWDRSIEGGEPWSSRIEQELDTARCVMVLWSRESITSDWVQREAAVGVRRAVLLPVLLAPVTPPGEFAAVQALSLMTWRGDERSYELRPLLLRLAALLGGSPPQVDEAVLTAAKAQLTTVDVVEATFEFCAARLDFFTHQRSGVGQETLDRMGQSYDRLLEILAPMSQDDLHALISRHEDAFTPPQPDAAARTHHAGG